MRSLDLPGERPAYRGGGVASETWLLKRSDFALRFMRSRNERAVTYPMEHVLLRRLDHGPSAVAVKPIVESSTTEAMPDGWKAWAMEEWRPGSPWRSNDGSDAWLEVGGLLRTVHGIESSGFGPLAATGDQLRGKATTGLDGLKQRWRTAPIWLGDDHAGLADLHRMAPATLEAIRPLGPAVADAAVSGPAVVLHSDLHAAHVLIDRGRLSGVLDFGGAFRGSPTWDFAAIGVFNGWAAAHDALLGYGGSWDSNLGRNSRLVGLAFAIYRFNVRVAEQNGKAAARLLSRLAETIRTIDW